MRLTFLLLTAASIIAIRAAAQKPITVGDTFQQHSKIFNEDYSVLVSLPRNYDEAGNKESYPVLYVLDGDGYLNLVSEAVKMLSSKNGNGVRGMPECIVIGITSNNRERDMSPPMKNGWAPPGNPMMDMSKIQWGGADRYLEHIEKEVIPYIESKYRTQPYRIIMGHSLAGLLAYHAMITKPHVFKTYVIGDPSVWWNDGNDLRGVMKYWKEHPDFKASLALFRPYVPQAYWFPVNKEFMEFMNTSKPAGIFYKYIELENELHTTVVYPGAYMALREIFKNYRYKINPKATLEGAQHHYDSLSAVFGYKIQMSQDLVDVLGEISNRNGK